MASLFSGKRASAFRDNEDGTTLVEAVLVLPALLWAFLALFVFWDGYRSFNVVQKASYTMADLISRTNLTKTLDATYINGLKSTMAYLLDPDQTSTMRVSSIQWLTASNSYVVKWSYSPSNSLPAYTTANLPANVKARIPVMADGNYITLVETHVPYNPVFDVGLNATTINQFIVTRARFEDCILYTGVTSC